MGRTGDRRLGCSTLASLENVSVNARVVWFSRMQTFHGAVPASVAELVLAFSDGSMRGTHDGRERTGIAIQQTLLLARQHTRWVQLRCNVPQVPTRRNNHLQYIGRLQTLAKIINVNNKLKFTTTWFRAVAASFSAFPLSSRSLLRTSRRQHRREVWAAHERTAFSRHPPIQITTSKSPNNLHSFHKIIYTFKQ